MGHIFNQLVKNLNQSHVIKPLLRREAFIIKVESGESSFYLELKNGVFTVLPTADNHTILLKGNRNSIEDVFEGRVLLRRAKKEQDVEVHSSLRKLLLLESLFHLVNVNEQAWCKSCS